jgi:YaiO family outer membrane protein
VPRHGVRRARGLVRPGRAAFLSVALASSVLGGASVVAAQAPSHLGVEAGYGQARLSANYPAWSNAYVRASLANGVTSSYQLEVVGRRAFDDRGVYFGAAATYPIARDWYGFASAGTSAGGFFFPRANAGMMIARRWLARRQLITTSAVNFYAHKDVHRDVLWTGSIVYYFRQPVAIELGTNVGRSAPGPAVSHSQFVVATVGDVLRRSVTARVSAGREAYTRLGLDTALVAFPSHVVSLRWRQLVTPEAGFVSEFEHYSNTAYRRTGFSVGAFVGTAVFGRQPAATVP